MNILQLLLCCMFMHAASATPKKIVTGSLPGNYSWELLLDIDNTNNSGNVTRQVEVVTTVIYSYSNLKKQLESSEVGASLSSSLGGTLFEVISATVKSEVSSTIRSVYEKLAEEKGEKKTETRRTDTYTIGPHSTFKLYRLVFNGPGVQYVTDTLSSNPKPMDQVMIDFTVKQLLLLKTIKVVYTSDSISRPDNVIQMAHGYNGDINAGKGGKYVWLVPVWTAEEKDAATGIEVVIQGDRNDAHDDLAAGAGGDYRYLKILRRYENNNQRVSDVGLYRSSDSLGSLEGTGWHYKTIDINQGRKSDWLYIVYKVVTV